MFECTCKCSKTACNSAFVYNPDGRCIAEVPAHLVAKLNPKYAFLCAGAGLQKLNRELKETRAMLDN